MGAWRREGHSSKAVVRNSTDCSTVRQAGWASFYMTPQVHKQACHV